MGFKFVVLFYINKNFLLSRFLPKSAVVTNNLSFLQTFFPTDMVDLRNCDDSDNESGQSAVIDVSFSAVIENQIHTYIFYKVT